MNIKKFKLSAFHVNLIIMAFVLLNSISVGFMDFSGFVSIIFQILGVASAPLICYLLFEIYYKPDGFRANVKRSMLTLTAFAVASQFQYMWLYYGELPLTLEVLTAKGNILFSIVICLGFMIVSSNYNKKIANIKYSGRTKELCKTNYLLGKQERSARLERARLRINKLLWLAFFLIFSLWCELAFLPIIFMLIFNSRRKSKKRQLIDLGIFSLIIAVIIYLSFKSLTDNNMDSAIPLVITFPAGLLISIIILIFYDNAEFVQNGNTDDIAVSENALAYPQNKLSAFVSQWSFCIFYSLHLLVLAVIRAII
ncbi:MAG: hypothetical protein FWG90_01870 [Oscillospiraceae bacterium]|nr:hypothetical protein [Oscillospiraceae bacterium]